jgi:predicted acyl esterase
MWRAMTQGAIRLRWAIVVAAGVLAAAAPHPASADPLPPDAAWHETYIKEPDGTVLHADVLRPKHLPAGARTPVILSVGPYFNHSGQTGPTGPVEDTPYNPVGPSVPSSRFYDFVYGARLLERGYTFVMVDLRGFGGSSGCLDWGGPGERADVHAAVRWAASRDWSTGRVGMYGKSYDGETGLFGVVDRTPGLAAVVSQEPVYDDYRYLYDNGVRFQNSLLTPALYDAIAASPGVAGDTLSYHVGSFNDLSRPGCPVLNYLDQQNSDHNAKYWRKRNLIDRARGSTVPLFLTQGFIENNTKPDGAFEFFNNLAGPKRAWFGMWDHVRGNERDADGVLKMGRPHFFGEVMRFFDHYVKGLPLDQAPTNLDPPVAVETSDGTWRSEAAWPPADARTVPVALRRGSYLDHSLNNGTGDAGPPNGDGIWTISPRLPHAAHLAGIPRLSLGYKTLLPNANLVGVVYDIGGGGKATLVSRGANLLRQAGTGDVTLKLYGNDWVFKPGHRIGVLVTSSNAEWWLHVPSLQNVTIRKASLTLPFLTCSRTQTIAGGRSIKLKQYLRDAPFEVPAGTIASGGAPAFPLPPAQAAC